MQNRYYLINEHQGEVCPDFLLKSAQGKIIGLEITEGTPYDDSNKEQKDKERFNNVLKAKVTDRPVGIIIYERPTWSNMRHNAEVIINRLVKRIEDLKGTCESLKNVPFDLPEFGLKTSIASDLPNMVMDISKTGFEYGNELENAFAEQTVQRIQSKLYDASAPNVMETYLAVYLNGAAGINANRLAKEVYSQVGDSYLSRFKDVWLCHGEKALSINSIKNG